MIRISQLKINIDKVDTKDFEREQTVVGAAIIKNLKII